MSLNTSIGQNFKVAVGDAKKLLLELDTDNNGVIDNLQVNRAVIDINNNTRTALLKTYDDINTDRIKSYSDGWRSFEADAPIKTFKQLTDEEIEAILNDSRGQYALQPTIDDINRKTTANIDNAIVNGVLNGIAITIIIATVTSIYKTAYNRSITTAYLETSGAVSVGIDTSYTTLNNRGVASEKQWVRTSSLNPRDIHLKMVGKNSSSGVFTLPDGVQTTAPRLTGYAKHDINCRCSIKAVFVKVS